MANIHTMVVMFITLRTALMHGRRPAWKLKKALSSVLPLNQQVQPTGGIMIVMGFVLSPCFFTV